MNKKISILIITCILTLSLVSCKKIKTAGVYEATGKGRSGQIKVSVTIDSKGEISDIQLMEFEDNKEFVEKAFEEIKNNIINEKSLDIDTVSGATQSSKGILEAIKNAVKESEKE
ncbi:MAG: FMN-binding protein [Lagierella massiliensis]|nr:FMN-binding protein [Lagierella massiliensis]